MKFPLTFHHSCKDFILAYYLLTTPTFRLKLNFMKYLNVFSKSFLVFNAFYMQIVCIKQNAFTLSLFITPKGEKCTSS